MASEYDATELRADSPVVEQQQPPQPEPPEQVLVPFGSPELCDGQYWGAMDKASILQSVEQWLKDAEDGDECTIKMKAMTKAEIEALPVL